MASPELFTIGYQARSLDDFVALLLEKSVEQVVDVRALPLSRKPGFSKTELGSRLAQHGIEYAHLRAAGNPFRELKGDTRRCLELYASHVDARPEIVDQLEQVLGDRRSALLCFELRPEQCHRSVLVERLCERSPRAVTHL